MKQIGYSLFHSRYAVVEKTRCLTVFWGAPSVSLMYSTSSRRKMEARGWARQNSRHFSNKSWKWSWRYGGQELIYSPCPFTLLLRPVFLAPVILRTPGILPSSLPTSSEGHFKLLFLCPSLKDWYSLESSPHSLHFLWWLHWPSLLQPLWMLKLSESPHQPDHCFALQTHETPQLDITQHLKFNLCKTDH